MHRAIVTVLILAGLGGCGASRAPTSRIAPPAAHPGDGPSLAQAKKRLQAAGYTVEDGDASGAVVESLKVTSGLGADIYSYRSPAAAIPDFRGIRAVFRAHPGRGIVRLIGAHLYSMGNTPRLTDRQRTSFFRLVAVAEGG